MTTLADRALAYGKRYPACQDSVWVAGGGRWLLGCWQIGNTYRNDSSYYGAFPRGFVGRVMALFPDIDECDVLHAFSGSLRPGVYTRLDISPAYSPELIGSVYDVQRLAAGRLFRLIVADPPYTAADAERYGTAPVDRARAVRALATVTRIGGHLAWLDTVWPMYRKREWHYYGAIEIRRSTNHRLRGLSLFERKAG